MIRQTIPTAMLGIALLAVAGCASTREARVRSSLASAGLPPATAACMATPLARDLSNSQLQALGRLGRTLKDERRQLSEREALELLRRDLDPEVVGVVLRAGLGCMLRG